MTNSRICECVIFASKMRELTFVVSPLSETILIVLLRHIFLFLGGSEFLPRQSPSACAEQKIDKVVRYNFITWQRVRQRETGHEGGGGVEAVVCICRSGIRIPGSWQFRRPTIRYNPDYFVKTRILNEPVKGARGQDPFWKGKIEKKEQRGKHEQKTLCKRWKGEKRDSRGERCDRHISR